MANFNAYYRGMCIESVSHPRTLGEAKRYFKNRYKAGEYPLVVLPTEASPEEIKAAIEKSKTKL